MLHKIRQAVRRDNKSILLAALFSGGFFAGNYPGTVAAPDLLARQVALAGLLFLLLYTMFRLFSAGVNNHVARELAEVQEANGRLIRLFVVYKEMVKTVVGVSLTLGWLAGLLFIVENFGQASLVLPVLMGAAFTGLLFAMALTFTSFMDHIRYPQAD
jgi:hypothetical protein